PQDDGRARLVRGGAGPRPAGRFGRAPYQGGAMSDDVTHRLSAEGVDPLALAGVNDANLLELARRLGVRVSLRGDNLSLAGPAAAIERAAPIAQALVDLARIGEPLDVHDVERIIAEEAAAEPGGSRPATDPIKII